MYFARPLGRRNDRGVPWDAVSDTGDDFSCSIPNMHVEYSTPEPPVPVWWWRSVGHPGTDFCGREFPVRAGGRGREGPGRPPAPPAAHSPRRLAVLNLAAEQSAWITPLPNGHARCIPLLDGFGNRIVAQVADVSLEGQKVRVHRVACAVDCGTVVNPVIVESQMESAVIYGLPAALMGEITLKDERVQRSSFTDYPVMRMNQSPKIDVRIVERSQDPRGISEPGTPPVAAAMANAVYALTKSGCGSCRSDWVRKQVGAEIRRRRRSEYTFEVATAADWKADNQNGVRRRPELLHGAKRYQHRPEDDQRPYRASRRQDDEVSLASPKGHGRQLLYSLHEAPDD